MRKTCFIIILLLLTLVSTAWKMPVKASLIEDITCTNTFSTFAGAAGANTVAITLGYVPTEGRTLIMQVSTFSNVVAYKPITSITQAGVTWTEACPHAVESTYYGTAEVWYGIVGAGASADITVTGTAGMGAGGVIHGYVSEYNMPLLPDVAAKVDTYSGTTPLTGTTAAITGSPELWIATMSINGGVATVSAPLNGFTLAQYNGVADYYVARFSKLVTLGTTGVANSGCTLTFGRSCCAAICTFKIDSTNPDSPAYHYTFYGVYYENGTRATALSSTVTIYSSDSTDSITVNNGYPENTCYFTSRPILISYTIDSGTATRGLYPTADTGDIYIWEPETTYAAYEFTIKDYINALSGDVFLRSSRVINGTSYTIERQKVTDSITAVALQLTVGVVYSLEVTTSIGYTFDAGYFIPASDTTGTISLRWPTFTQQAQLTYRYVTVEATRPTATSITVEVNNTLAYTYNMTLIEVWVNLRNGTNAYYVNSTAAAAYTVTWLGATNSTDYDVYVEVTHSYFGVLKYETSLTGDFNFAAAPDLGVFGTVGSMDTGNLLPVFIMFVAGGLVSTLSVGLGAFTVAVLAGTFTWMEWWTLSDTMLYTILALAMLVAISERRGQG